MARLDSVFRHAITPPTFDEGIRLHRERLVDIIHANIARKLIIIAAPAGYGKTTLLANFTNDTELPVCWMRLSSADRDVVRFVQVLALSLQRRFRRLQGEIDFERFSGLSPDALARVFIDLIDRHIAETFVIAIDDVHIINDSKETTQFLDRFLEELPDQITVIAAGREVLEVSLARLMAESNLFGLGPQDLALSRSEVRDLAKLNSDVEMSEEQAERLQRETRGWITGIILSSALSGRGLGGLMASERPLVYEYLASVVLNRQPDDLRRFMLDTSVFPIMTVEGCNHLLQSDDSNRFLHRLVQSGLFVTATEDGPRTYEFHPQFREFLLETLRGADSKRFHALTIRAAEYLAGHDADEHAVELYIMADAHGRAAGLANRRAREMYRAGRWQTLESWAEHFSKVDAHAPMVLLYLAGYQANQGKFEKAGAVLQRGRAMLKPNDSKAIRSMAEIVQGYIALGLRQYDEVLEYVAKAEKILSPSGSRERKGDCFRLRALTRFSLGELEAAEKYASQAVDILQKTDAKATLAAALVDYSNIEYALGNFTEAHSAALRAHNIFLEIGAPMMLAISFNNLAYDAHQQGQYEEALNLYIEGLKFARQASSPPREIRILYGQADLFSDLDLALQSAELYGQGLNLAIEIEDMSLIRYGCIRTSVLHRRRSGSGLAHDWLRRALSLEEVTQSPPEVVIQTAALETKVKPERALSSLKRMLESETVLDAESRTQALYFMARAALEKGDFKHAHNALLRCIDWAGARSTEQVIVGEMAFDRKLRDFARLRCANHPVLSVILHRIDTMRAVAQQYQQVSSEEKVGYRQVFTALGENSVQLDDETLVDLKPLAREVLFYLVDHLRVDRDVLLERFWPHHPPGRQVANLHTAVYSLRRALGRETILHEGSTYFLNPEISIEYDVARFERAASVAAGLPPGDPRRMFALTEAINSYGGLFLPDFVSDWVIERRRALEIHYLDLLAQHAEEALVRDQPLRAVNTLRQALQIDPYRDDTNMRFLEALGRLGRRSEIVAHYQRYVNLLSSELGLDPPKPIRELYSRLID